MSATCLTVAAIAFDALAQAPSAGALGKWSTSTPISAPRMDAGVALVNGRIYVFGGETAGHPATPVNQEFDPPSGRWRDRASIPSATSHAGVAAYNGKIYVIGGFTAVVHAVPLNRVFEYDVSADTWRELPPISSPLGSVGVAAVAGKIHAIGGRGPNNITVATHQVYDLASGKWSPAAPLPTARDHFGIVVVDGKIHVIGGRISNHIYDNSKPAVPPIPFNPENNGDNTSLHDIYDAETNSWQSAAPLPTARSNGAAVYYRGLILYAGGECKKPNPKGGGDTFSENEAYHLKMNRWLRLAPLPAGHQGFGAAAVGQDAYFISGSLGCGGGPMTDQVLSFHLP
jgi:N-acetylneuraminic acid mutarotase